MKKTLLVTVILLISLLLATIPAGAASWKVKVTGGMSYAMPYGEFTVTLSAKENVDGTFKGQGQYYYPPANRTFHLKVKKLCTGIVPSGPYDGQQYAIGVGKVFGQDGTNVINGFGGIAVAEGGNSGDGVRVTFDKTWAEVEDWCDSGAGSLFPAKVVDGNFNIRSK